MFDVNEYFDGKVKSLAFTSGDDKATIGVMAAGEYESELVVAHGSFLFEGVSIGIGGLGRVDGELLMELAAPRRATEGVDGPVAGGRDDPARRLGRDTVAPPPVARHDEGVLDRVFGKGDITEDTDQGRHRLAVDVPKDTLDVACFPIGDDPGHTLTRPVARKGRTSIEWLTALATLPAQSRAASRSAALMM